MEKIIKLNEKELEIINMLVDEEYEILKANINDDKNIDIKDLINIKAKLVLTDNLVDDRIKPTINNDVRLGMEIKTLENYYDYDNLISFLKGKTQSCYSFEKIKPLYDKYGYKLVNNVLLELDREEKEKREKEEKEAGEQNE